MESIGWIALVVGCTIGGYLLGKRRHKRQSGTIDVNVPTPTIVPLDSFVLRSQQHDYPSVFKGTDYTVVTVRQVLELQGRYFYTVMSYTNGELVETTVLPPIILRRLGVNVNSGVVTTEMLREGLLNVLNTEIKSTGA